jgi:hypothetical protein
MATCPAHHPIIAQVGRAFRSSDTNEASRPEAYAKGREASMGRGARSGTTAYQA